MSIKERKALWHKATVVKMKKILSNKWVIISLSFALLLFVLFGIVNPYLQSVITSDNGHIESLVHDLCKYPEIDKESVEKLRSFSPTYSSKSTVKQKRGRKKKNEIV